MALSRDDISSCLDRMSSGEPGAADELLPLVYEDLRSVANQLLRGGASSATLQPTMLVHDAFMRLVGSQGDRAGFNDRAHFMAVAALAMRQILTDYARRRRAQKRGGNVEHVDYEQIDIGTGDQESQTLDVLALDEALTALAEHDPRMSRIVELRFFAGLSVNETAEVLGVSERTVRLDWSMARAWLSRRLGAEFGEASA